MMKMQGYVIVPPVSEWDNREVVFPLMSYHTLGKNPTEAWLRFLRMDHYDSMKIQRAFDQGYRLKKATMEIHDDETVA